jgi:two-component system, NtrC family, sensor kinase
MSEHGDWAACIRLMPWPVIVLDDASRIVACSPAAESLSALERSPIGERFDLCFGQLAEVVAAQGCVAVLERGGREYRLRLSVRRDGALRYVFMEDRTEVCALESHAMQSSRLASLGFMLAGACHEVSNPLASTYSMVQMLRSRSCPADDMIHRGLGNIEANVRRILEVTRRISAFSRVLDERGTATRADDLVDEAVAMLGVESRFPLLVIERERDPQALIHGRLSELRQALFNILLNAGQALEGKAGRVRVSVSHRRHGSVGMVVIQCEDSGPGIAVGVINRVFDPFFSTKPSGDGTGLGLAITQELIREHGGSILAARSETLGGARFTVTLPLWDERVPA